MIVNLDLIAAGIHDNDSRAVAVHRHIWLSDMPADMNRLIGNAKVSTLHAEGRLYNGRNVTPTMDITILQTCSLRFCNPQRL
jgi:hypothetical protein